MWPRVRVAEDSDDIAHPAHPCQPRDFADGSLGNHRANIRLFPLLPDLPGQATRSRRASYKISGIPKGLRSVHHKPAEHRPICTCLCCSQLAVPNECIHVGFILVSARQSTHMGRVLCPSLSSPDFAYLFLGIPGLRRSRPLLYGIFVQESWACVGWQYRDGPWRANYGELNPALS